MDTKMGQPASQPPELQGVAVAAVAVGAYSAMCLS